MLRSLKTLRGLLLLTCLYTVHLVAQITPPAGGGSGGITVPSTSDVLTGNGSGGVSDSGIAWVSAFTDTAISAAITSLPARGGAVFLPPGDYAFTTGITSTKPSVWLVCMGGQGWGSDNGGACRFIGSTASMVFLTIGSAGASNHQGWRLSNIIFVDSGGTPATAGAIKGLRMSYMYLDNDGCYNFSASGAYCIDSDGTGDANAEWRIDNLTTRNVDVGIKLISTQGPTITGGELGTNTTGIDFQSTSDTLRLYGTHLDVKSGSIGINVAGNSGWLEPRCEDDGSAGIGTCVNITAAAFKNHVAGVITGMANGVVVAAPSSTSDNEFSPLIYNTTTPYSGAGLAGYDNSFCNHDLGCISNRLDSATPTTGGFYPSILNGYGSMTKFIWNLANAGFGMFVADSKSSTTGLMLNSDQGTANKRACVGYGKLGNCGTGAAFAYDTSAAWIDFNNTIGQLDFYGNTGLTAGSGFTPVLLASVNATGVIGVGFATTTNCSNAAAPAVCAAAPDGAVAIPTGVNPTLTVNTTAVTANSRILLMADDSLTIAATTCNSTLATLVGGMAVTARTPGTSFTISFNGTVTTNKVCVSYKIEN
jgi:hypothetical protein